jgi:hypothetical protein
MTRFWTAALILLRFCFFQQLPEIDIQDVTVSYEFSQQITFRAHLEPADEIQEVYLFLQPVGETTRLGKAEVSTDGDLVFVFDAQKDPLEPFIHVVYWLRVILKDQQEIESQRFSFDYNDNRFEWQSLQDEQFVVHWYEGEMDFGQSVLNVAHQGLDSATSILPVDISQQINIYVYARSVDLQGALQSAQRTWVAGHASPVSSIILITVPAGPAQRLELERQIPHEMVHLLEYQLVGKDYTRMPVWLVEGLASMAELYPNPEYQRVLQTSAREGNLLSISTLCESFPRDASGAFLAYAQAKSFTQFLYETYGSSGLLTLIQHYQDGLGYEEGAAATFGSGLQQLEFRWQQEVLGVQAGYYKLRNLSPYLFLLGVLVIIPLIPFLSTGNSRKP